MQLHRRTILNLGALLLTTACAGCGGSATPAPIFIGHVLLTDGPAGKEAERGIQLALDELGPQASESLGNGRPLVVRHVDAASPDGVEAAAARLVSVNRVLALLGGATSEAVQRLERVPVPVLTPLGYRTSGMSDLVLTTGLSPARQGELLAKHLAEKTAGATILVVDQRRAEEQAAAESFKRAWAEATTQNAADAKRLVEAPFGKDAKFDELAERIGQAKPKTLIFAGAPEDFRALKRVLKTAGLTLVYAGEDGALRSADLAPGESVLVATAFALDKEAAPVQAFADKYRAKFHDAPSVHAALAYDNVRLLAEALQKGQTSAADKLRDELLKVKDFAGLTGLLSFDGQPHLRRPAFIARLTPGAPPTAITSVAP